MKLYEVQATEYNGEQEYFQSKLLTAENTDQAWQIARDYFRQWYDDGDEPETHNTDDPNEFEFINGCIRLRIKSVQETALDEWINTRITLHSISALPESLIKIANRIQQSLKELQEEAACLRKANKDLIDMSSALLKELIKAREVRLHAQDVLQWLEELPIDEREHLERIIEWNAPMSQLAQAIDNTEGMHAIIDLSSALMRLKSLDHS